MKIENLLIDIDGVLRIGEKEIIPGARETLSYIRKCNMNPHFLSNGTRASRETIAKQLQSIGLDIKKDEIFTAPIATALHMK
jgi:ribonucleotide monophosphatase NagD (HAD superfamily)